MGLFWSLVTDSETNSNLESSLTHGTGTMDLSRCFLSPNIVKTHQDAFTKFFNYFMLEMVC